MEMSVESAMAPQWIQTDRQAGTYIFKIEKHSLPVDIGFR